ncbi:DUF4259 domain-containing protein [Paenibacillus sp. FSL K6-1217]|uniref:DUF4259 domain-containing protein n=1 Tax=Paenibacillus sp. FSL K6-1217 TaxID=2921466 RepID=UPI00324C6107
MGAWGITALESDEGLDLVAAIEDMLPRDTLDLGELMTKFGEDHFLYDGTVLALAELYIEFLEKGRLDYDHEEKVRSLTQVRAFTADRISLGALLEHLNVIWTDIEGDCEGDLAELWRESPSWDEWRAHVQQLIAKLDARLAQEQ